MSELNERIAKAAELAAPIYAAHGWKWGDRYGPGAYEVPTAPQIAAAIRGLYESALHNRTGICSSGRLSVYVDEDDGSIAVDVQLADLRDEVPGWIPPDESE